MAGLLSDFSEYVQPFQIAAEPRQQTMAIRSFPVLTLPLLSCCNIPVLSEFNDSNRTVRFQQHSFCGFGLPDSRAVHVKQLRRSVPSQRPSGKRRPRRWRHPHKSTTRQFTDHVYWKVTAGTVTSIWRFGFLINQRRAEEAKIVYPPSMKESTEVQSEKITPFQLALLVLSILVLLALLVDTVAPVNREVSTIIQMLDTVVCVLFFTDFVIRFRRTPSKREFMRWGWIDLIACIPNIDLLRFGRMVRILRIIRLLRGLRVGHRVLSVLLQNKPKSAFASVMLTTILLITFSSIAILIAEQGPEANIKSADDAIWWSVTTITTVGYGDKYPTSMEGRVIAMVLMLSGVGLFGTLSGLVASFFLGSREEESAELKEILIRLQQLDERLKSSSPTQPTSNFER